VPDLFATRNSAHVAMWAPPVTSRMRNIVTHHHPPMRQAKHSETRVYG